MIGLPGVRVEPTRPFGQRILSRLKRALPDLTKRDEPIYTGLTAVEVMLRRLSLSTYCRHLRVIVTKELVDQIAGRRSEEFTRGSALICEAETKATGCPW